MLLAISTSRVVKANSANFARSVAAYCGPAMLTAAQIGFTIWRLATLRELHKIEPCHEAMPNRRGFLAAGLGASVSLKPSPNSRHPNFTDPGAARLVGNTRCNIRIRTSWRSTTVLGATSSIRRYAGTTRHAWSRPGVEWRRPYLFGATSEQCAVALD